MKGTSIQIKYRQFLLPIPQEMRISKALNVSFMQSHHRDCLYNELFNIHGTTI